VGDKRGDHSLHRGVCQGPRLIYLSIQQGLISPAWLETHLDDPDLAILDVRGEVAKGPVQQDGSQVGGWVYACVLCV
jgi:hypothetical protein